MLEFAEELRSEGVAIGTSELLDSFAALGEVEWTDTDAFREALAATLAKSPDDRRVFDLVFERFFFRAAEAAAVRHEVREEGGMDPNAMGSLDVEELRAQIAAALAAGAGGGMRAPAGMPIAAFGRRGEGSGVIGVDVQPIRRQLGLGSEPQPELP